jgi:general secretion pathway protein B
MSYILDALRKSDQMRRRGAAPTLLLGQAPPAAAKRPALLSYGLPALVLLAAGIAIGWLRPWEPEPVVPVPVEVEAKPAAPEEIQAPALRAETAPAPKAIAAPPVRAAATAQPQAGVGTKRRSAPPKAVAKQPERTPAPAPMVTTMSELPVAIQQALPAMSITVHAYSDKAADRLVGINDRLLHEGEEVAPGLRLEQITPDGMVLSYKGYRFRRGVH